MKDGPMIRIPITSLKSNALLVGDVKTQNRTRVHEFNTTLKKIKLNTNILYNRFHRFDGAMATIKAHDLW